MKTHIMLDLETLGTKPRSVILAIGAVKFADGIITDTFYARIDAESCVNLGLQMDVATVMWWLKQSQSARAEITQPGETIIQVLHSFAEWISDRDAEVWGNGASFDNVLLSDAYDIAYMERPWKYFNDRCYRTVKALHPDIPMHRTGTHHNALDDAKSQARHLMEILSRSSSADLGFGAPSKGMAATMEESPALNAKAD